MFKIKLVPEDAWAAFRSLGRELGGRVRRTHRTRQTAVKIPDMISGSVTSRLSQSHSPAR